MSSPAERKISYAELADFSAVGGVVRPLIDSGLGGPAGIAYDAPRKALYVADPPKRQIVRYSIAGRFCRHKFCKIRYELVQKSVQLVMVQNVLSSWVSVDSEGSLYFTNQETQSVNKVDIKVVQNLVSMIVKASDLTVVTGTEVRALEKVATAAELNGQTQDDVPTPTEAKLRASIESLYQAGTSSYLGLPTGVISDAGMVYWGNQEVNKGAVGSGSANAQAISGSEGQTMLVSNTSDAIYGISTTHSMILYAGANALYGVQRVTGQVVTLSNTLISARSLVWDGDSTVYIADMGSDAVYSAPCGQPGGIQVLKRVVDFHAPFGLAVVGPEQNWIQGTPYYTGDDAWRNRANGRGTLTNFVRVSMTVALTMWYSAAV
eukprot:CAMPEP_0172909530 /NCGR_PEP_ID=MMETSP1075-20121228/182862_1 /TAXON_ID=2916 /ORGANISM="Ceratium fusus, Strain PA161109" /LENGTH=376 /DNA_ID=CAMNT_0013767503 /DNA_START=189 /DNA_END=1315 /DNA_ORIENTATION=-